MWAIICGHLEIAQLIVTKGMVDINARDKDRWTALHHAVDLGHDKVATLLVRGYVCEAAQTQG